MLTAELETQPIDAYAVALVETDDYFISPADAPFIQAIRGVYIFDRNSRTNCCELTPSYRLIHLYDLVDCQPGTTEERFQQLTDTYGNLGGEDNYYHCREIDPIVTAADQFTVCHLGRPVTRVSRQPIPYEETSHDEQMEELRETYSGNCPL